MLRFIKKVIWTLSIDVSDHKLQLEELQAQGCDCSQMVSLMQQLVWSLFEISTPIFLSIIFFGYFSGQAYEMLSEKTWDRKNRRLEALKKKLHLVAYPKKSNSYVKESSKTLFSAAWRKRWWWRIIGLLTGYLMWFDLLSGNFLTCFFCTFCCHMGDTAQECQSLS